MSKQEIEVPGRQDTLTKLFTAEQIVKRVTELGAEITEDYAGKPVTLIIVMKGAMTFAVDLMRFIDAKKVPDLKLDVMIASSYNGTESTSDVRIILDRRDPIEGRHVLVIEDIVDTGRTIKRLLSHLDIGRPGSLQICTLFNKPSRRLVQVSTQYVGFEIDDYFIVGYGLDVDEYYRQLPYVAVVS